MGLQPEQQQATQATAHSQNPTHRHMGASSLMLWLLLAVDLCVEAALAEFNPDGIRGMPSLIAGVVVVSVLVAHNVLLFAGGGNGFLRRDHPFGLPSPVWHGKPK